MYSRQFIRKPRQPTVSRPSDVFEDYTDYVSNQPITIGSKTKPILPGYNPLDLLESYTNGAYSRTEPVGTPQTRQSAQPLPLNKLGILKGGYRYQSRTKYELPQRDTSVIPSLPQERDYHMNLDNRNNDRPTNRTPRLEFPSYRQTSPERATAEEAQLIWRSSFVQPQNVLSFHNLSPNKLFDEFENIPEAQRKQHVGLLPTMDRRKERRPITDPSIDKYFIRVSRNKNRQDQSSTIGENVNLNCCCNQKLQPVNNKTTPTNQVAGASMELQDIFDLKRCTVGLNASVDQPVLPLEDKHPVDNMDNRVRNKCFPNNKVCPCITQRKKYLKNSPDRVSERYKLYMTEPTEGYGSGDNTEGYGSDDNTEDKDSKGVKTSFEYPGEHEPQETRNKATHHRSPERADRPSQPEESLQPNTYMHPVAHEPQELRNKAAHHRSPERANRPSQREESLQPNTYMHPVPHEPQEIRNKAAHHRSPEGASRPSQREESLEPNTYMHPVPHEPQEIRNKAAHHRFPERANRPSQREESLQPNTYMHPVPHKPQEFRNNATHHRSPEGANRPSQREESLQPNTYMHPVADKEHGREREKMHLELRNETYPHGTRRGPVTHERGVQPSEYIPSKIDNENGRKRERPRQELRNEEHPSGVKAGSGTQPMESIQSKTDIPMSTDGSPYCHTNCRCKSCTVAQCFLPHRPDTPLRTAIQLCIEAHCDAGGTPQAGTINPKYVSGQNRNEHRDKDNEFNAKPNHVHKPVERIPQNQKVDNDLESSDDWSNKGMSGQSRLSDVKRFNKGHETAHDDGTDKDVDTQRRISPKIPIKNEPIETETADENKRYEKSIPTSDKRGTDKDGSIDMENNAPKVTHPRMPRNSFTDDKEDATNYDTSPSKSSRKNSPENMGIKSNVENDTNNDLGTPKKMSPKQPRENTLDNTTRNRPTADYEHSSIAPDGEPIRAKKDDSTKVEGKNERSDTVNENELRPRKDCPNKELCDSREDLRDSSDAKLPKVSNRERDSMKSAKHPSSNDVFGDQPTRAKKDDSTKAEGDNESGDTVNEIELRPRKDSPNKELRDPRGDLRYSTGAKLPKVSNRERDSMKSANHPSSNDLLGDDKDSASQKSIDKYPDKEFSSSITVDEPLPSMPGNWHWKKDDGIFNSNASSKASDHVSDSESEQLSAQDVEPPKKVLGETSKPPTLPKRESKVFDNFTPGVSNIKSHQNSPPDLSTNEPAVTHDGTWPVWYQLADRNSSDWFDGLKVYTDILHPDDVAGAVAEDVDALKLIEQGKFVPRAISVTESKPPSETKLTHQPVASFKSDDSLRRPDTNNGTKHEMDAFHNPSKNGSDKPTMYEDDISGDTKHSPIATANQPLGKHHPKNDADYPTMYEDDRSGDTKPRTTTNQPVGKHHPKNDADYPTMYQDDRSGDSKPKTTASQPVGKHHPKNDADYPTVYEDDRSGDTKPRTTTNQPGGKHHPKNDADYPTMYQDDRSGDTKPITTANQPGGKHYVNRGTLATHNEPVGKHFEPADYASEDQYGPFNNKTSRMKNAVDSESLDCGLFTKNKKRGIKLFGIRNLLQCMFNPFKKDEIKHPSSSRLPSESDVPTDSFPKWKHVQGANEKVRCPCHQFGSSSIKENHQWCECFRTGTCVSHCHVWKKKLANSFHNTPDSMSGLDATPYDDDRHSKAALDKKLNNLKAVDGDSFKRPTKTHVGSCQHKQTPNTKCSCRSCSLQNGECECGVFIIDDLSIAKSTHDPYIIESRSDKKIGRNPLTKSSWSTNTNNDPSRATFDEREAKGHFTGMNNSGSQRDSMGNPKYNEDSHPGIPYSRNSETNLRELPKCICVKAGHTICMCYSKKGNHPYNSSLGPNTGRRSQDEPNLGGNYTTPEHVAFMTSSKLNFDLSESFKVNLKHTISYLNVNDARSDTSSSMLYYNAKKKPSEFNPMFKQFLSKHARTDKQLKTPSITDTSRRTKMNPYSVFKPKMNLDDEGKLKKNVDHDIKPKFIDGEDQPRVGKGKGKIASPNRYPKIPEIRFVQPKKNKNSELLSNFFCNPSKSTENNTRPRKAKYTKKVKQKGS